jgi:hypothetical protein
MNNLFLCLYCWQKTRAADLIFTCPICASPEGSKHPLDRGVGPRRVKRVVPWWRRSSGIRLHGVRCPIHRDTLATFSCPTCHRPVRPDAMIRDRHMVGLGVAGYKSSGKTTMMLGALPELGVGGGSGRAFHVLGIGSTDLRFREAHDEFYRVRSKSKLTSQHEVLEGFGWRTRAADDPDDAEQLLVMSDLAGQFWSGEGENGLNREARERVDRYTGLLDKMVLVLDGAQIAADLGLQGDDAWDTDPRTRTNGFNDTAVLGNLLGRFGDARASEIELALAVSKGDLLWDTWKELQDSAENGEMLLDDAPVRELLERSKRGALITWAKQFKDHRAFIFSSLGFRPEETDIDPENGTLLRPPSPVGVSAPIRWLIDPSARGAG